MKTPEELEEELWKRFEAPIVRTPSFLNAISNKDFGQAQESLISLRDQYVNDSWSLLTIDRFLASLLTKSGKREEAYSLLQELEPKLLEFDSDMSSHYDDVVSLQQKLGKFDEMRRYCKKIRCNFKADQAIFYLDWIAKYVVSSDDTQPTDFMFTIVAVSTIQLNLDLPPRPINGSEFRILVERCVSVSESAYERCLEFWKQHRQLTTTEETNALIKRFVQNEPCPFYRDLAMEGMPYPAEVP